MTRDRAKLYQEISYRREDQLFEAKLAIFDLDDTLVMNRHATLLARDAAIRSLFGENLQDQDRFELLDKWQRLMWFFGPNEREAVFKALVLDQCASDKLIERLTIADRVYERVLMSNLKCVDGAQEVLDKLSKREIKVALISNGIAKRQWKKIQKTGLGNFFRPSNTLIPKEGSPMAKPHPTSILKMCDQLEVPPDKTFLVGDRISDIVAANMAGCKSVLFYQKNLEVRAPSPIGNRLEIEVPDYSISTLKDFLKIISPDCQ